MKSITWGCPVLTALMTAIPLAILYTARRLVDAAARLETIRTEPVPEAKDGTPT